MSSANGQLLLSSRSIALPPIAIDFGMPSSVSRVIAGIKALGAQLMLNRCQFKRIESMCLYIHQNMPCSESTPAHRLLFAVHARCAIWHSTGLLQSLVVIPEDMDKFERQCIVLSARKNLAPNIDDKTSEQNAITSAIQEIISNEQVRSQAMALRGRHAELFVSHLQTALDESPGMDLSLREECIKALRKLAIEAEVLPSSLKIDEVTFLNGNQPVASGGFSDVYQGKWQKKVVAVKRPRIFTSQGDNTETLKRNRREILLWRQLSHDYVLPLLGIFHEDRLLDSMVSEWMPNGTLKKFLMEPQRQESNRLQLLFQVAQGLQYLHSHRPPVAHGDIKASNILVDANLRPVIGDFGLSCNHYSIDRTMSSTLEGGSVRWMAPEMLLPENGRYPPKPTLASDVWSYGMLMLEVFTDEDPYGDEPDHFIPTKILEKKMLPARPPAHITHRGLADDVWGRIGECWNYKSEERPKMEYMVRNLNRWSQNVLPTAWEEGTETMFIPSVSIGRVITSDAKWKTLDVKVSKERGSIIKNGVQTTVISITGNSGSRAEACLRISESIKKSGDSDITDHLLIPKQLHSRLIGQNGRHVKRLKKKHGVQIIFPARKSPSAKVVIIGSTVGIEGAKTDLQKMIKFEHTSRDVIDVSLRAAEVISERLQDILRPPLRELDIKAGKVTLRGHPKGIALARATIRTLEEKIAREVTEELSVDHFLHDMIKSDPQAWGDIVDRCGGPACSDTNGEHTLLDIIPNRLRVRGTTEFVKLVRDELNKIMEVGHTCVMGKRIAARRHESLIGPQGELIRDLRNHTGAMVYFPRSGGYAAVGMPNNMHRYENVDPEDIVKLVGSPNACEKAREYLEDRVEEQRKKEQNPVYRFPAGLHFVVKSRTDSLFRTLGIYVEPETPAPAQSIRSFVSEAPNRVTATGPDWKIHMRDDGSQLPMCQWRLVAKSAEALTKGGDFLTKEIMATYRRIGILSQGPANLCLVKENLDVLKNQDEQIFFEIVEQEGLVVVAGPSTDKVESAIKKTLALVESLRD